MSKRFVIGDIHGCHRALQQVFKRAEFRPETDELISLGDVVDGWPESKEVIQSLVRIKHLIQILGNHDTWFLEWANGGCRMEDLDELWVDQGGEATLQSYGYKPVPSADIEFLERSRLWYQDPQGRVFVHGGIIPGMPLNQQTKDTCIWDRELIHRAFLLDIRNRDSQGEAKLITEHPEIYVGHTTTLRYHSEVPVHFCEVWGMDTGAGWEGRLSMMNIETKELFQSDPVYDLYPDAEHSTRNKVFKKSGAAH